MDSYSIVLLNFITITTQIKLYHWNTLSHPRHLASGQLYSEFDELVDKFIEVLQGRIISENLKNAEYRIKLHPKIKIRPTQYNDEDAIQLILNIKNYLTGNELFSIIGNYTDLVNIRDEMLAVVDKTSYLFSLK